MVIPTTLSLPKASTATVAVSAESIPPDRPINALVKPDLRR